MLGCWAGYVDVATICILLCVCVVVRVQVDDAMLDRLLDRTHLLADESPLPYPASGVGYEVVVAQDSSTLLRGVE